MGREAGLSCDASLSPSAAIRQGQSLLLSNAPRASAHVTADPVLGDPCRTGPVISELILFTVPVALLLFVANLCATSRSSDQRLRNRIAQGKAVAKSETCMRSFLQQNRSLAHHELDKHEISSQFLPRSGTRTSTRCSWLLMIEALVAQLYSSKVSDPD